MKSYVYTVQTSAAVAVQVGKPSSAMDPDSVLLKSPSTNTATIYIGGPDVTSSNGYPISPGDPAIGLDANATENVYAVSGTSSQTLRILKKYDS